MEKPNLAIAYAMKKKSKKMASGGSVQDEEAQRLIQSQMMHNDAHKVAPMTRDEADKREQGLFNSYQKDEEGMSLAKGGLAGSNEEDADMITRIMHKRKMMAEGGLVEQETLPEADEDSSDYDYLSSGDLDDHSTNSGESDGDEHGDAKDDEDRKDIVSRIMKQRSMKQRNPNPA